MIINGNPFSVFSMAVNQLTQASLPISPAAAPLRPDSFILVDEKKLDPATLALLGHSLSTGWMSEKPRQTPAFNFVPVRLAPQIFANGSTGSPQIMAAGEPGSPSNAKPSSITLLELRYQARDLVKAGDFAAALSLYERILQDIEVFSAKRQNATLCEMANVCKLLGQLEKAEALIRRALSIQEHPRPLHALAAILRITNRFEEADSLKKRAEELNLAIKQHEAELKLLFTQAAYWIQEKKWKEAAAIWEELLVKEASYFYENSINYLLQAAKVYTELQNWPRAETLLRQAIERAKNEGQREYIFFHFGLFLAKAGRQEEANAAFAQAKRNPDDNPAKAEAGDRIGALKNVGRAAMEYRDFKKAVDIYRQLLDWEELVTHQNPITAFNLGLALMHDGQLEKAEEIFQLSLKLRVHPRALCMLGIVQSRLGKFSESIVSFKRAAVLENGRMPQTFAEMTRTYLHWGSLQDALESIKRARMLEGEKPHPQTLFLMGEVFYRLNRFQQALAAVRECEQHEKEKISETLILKANILRKMGRYSEALEVIAEVKQLDAPDEFPDVRTTEAKVFMAMRKYDWALAVYDRVIELEERCKADSFAGKTKVLEKMGRYPEALQCIEQAIEKENGNKSFRAIKARILRAMEKLS